MALGAYLGSFAQGIGEGFETSRNARRQEQADLSTAATTLQNFLKNNPQATRADIEAFAANLHPKGVEGILGPGGLQRAVAHNAEIYARNKKNQELADQTAALQFNTALTDHANQVNNIFTNTLNETIANTPFGQQAMESADIVNIIDQTATDLSARFPHLDFSEVKKFYSSEWAQTRAQKRASSRSKKAEEARTAIIAEVERDPSFYSDQNNLNALRQRIRSTHGFGAETPIIDDAEVANYLNSASQKQAAEQWNQSVELKSRVDDLMRDNIFSLKETDFAPAGDQESVAIQRARQQLASVGIVTAEAQNDHLQRFDPVGLKRDAEAKLQADYDQRLNSLATTHDSVESLKQALGWGQHNFSDAFESYLKGKIDNNSISRQTNRTQSVATFLYADLPNATNVISNALAGNDQALNEWIAKYNQANPYQVPVTKDEVFTAVQRLDLKRFQDALKEQGDGLTNAVGDRFQTPSDISKTVNIESVAGTMNLSRVQRDLLIVMMNDGLISSQEQLGIYAQRIKDKAILGDYVEGSSSVNLPALGREIASNTLSAQQLSDQATWDQIRSNMNFINDPDAHLAEFESDMESFSAELSKSISNLENDFNELGFAARNNEITENRKELLLLNSHISALRSQLNNYGTAVPTYYNQFVSAIQAIEQKEAALSQRLNALDDSATEARRQSPSYKSLGVDSGDFTNTDSGQGQNYINELNSRIQQASGLAKKLYSRDKGIPGVYLTNAETAYKKELTELRTQVRDIRRVINDWQTNPQNAGFGSVPLTEILSDSQLAALEKITKLGSPEEELLKHVPERFQNGL